MIENRLEIVIITRITLKIAFMKKSSGTEDDLLSAFREKEAKERMSSNEMIGHFEENQLCFDSVTDLKDYLNSVAISKSLTTVSVSDSMLENTQI